MSDSMATTMKTTQQQQQRQIVVECIGVDNIPAGKNTSPEALEGKLLVCQDVRRAEVPSSLETFTPFLKLPPEIKVRIWQLACVKTRILQDLAVSSSRYIIPKSRPPVIAHVCHEPRSEASKSSSPKHPNHSWWNFAHDIFFFSDYGYIHSYAMV
jgi:hypothetical protein